MLEFGHKKTRSSFLGGVTLYYGEFDRIFAALSNPTACAFVRCGIIPATIPENSQPSTMTDKSDFDCLIDEAQLAKRWDKSTSTIRKYRSAGKLAFVTVNGRIKFRMTEVKRYEESDGKIKPWLNPNHSSSRFRL